MLITNLSVSSMKKEGYRSSCSSMCIIQLKCPVSSIQIRVVHDLQRKRPSIAGGACSMASRNAKRSKSRKTTG